MVGAVAFRCFALDKAEVDAGQIVCGYVAVQMRGIAPWLMPCPLAISVPAPSLESRSPLGLLTCQKTRLPSATITPAPCHVWFLPTTVKLLSNCNAPAPWLILSASISVLLSNLLDRMSVLPASSDGMCLLSFCGASEGFAMGRVMRSLSPCRVLSPLPLSRHMSSLVVSPTSSRVSYWRMVERMNSGCVTMYLLKKLSKPA